MAWEYNSDQRYIPFYCAKRDEMHISCCWTYEIDEYWGVPLSTSGYDTEEEAIDAMRSADLPIEVQRAFDIYCQKEGITYKGILDA